jgi:hypothetical protein
MRKRTLISLVILTVVLGIVGEATTPWIPIVKNGDEGNLLSTSGPSKAVGLSGASPAAFPYIRGQVKALTDPINVEKRTDYGEFGLENALLAYPDDVLPIAVNDYVWWEKSPIYWNPHMDYYWGAQTVDYDSVGWYESVPQKYEEWKDNTMSWDDHTHYLDAWANKDS